MVAKDKCRAEIRRRKPDSRNSDTQDRGLEGWSCFQISHCEKFEAAGSEVGDAKFGGSWNSPHRVKRQSRAWVTLYSRESCKMHEIVKRRSRRFGASVNRPNQTTSTQANGKLR
jgi:hypothetical protein